MRVRVNKPQLLMPVIQYVMPSRNKQLKKLLHFYWEVCPKYDDNGKLKQEMILVWCVSRLENTVLNDLYVCAKQRNSKRPRK